MSSNQFKSIQYNTDECFQFRPTQFNSIQMIAFNSAQLDSIFFIFVLKTTNPGQLGGETSRLLIQPMWRMLRKQGWFLPHHFPPIKCTSEVSGFPRLDDWIRSITISVKPLRGRIPPGVCLHGQPC